MRFKGPHNVIFPAIWIRAAEVTLAHCPKSVSCAAVVRLPDAATNRCSSAMATFGARLSDRKRPQWRRAAASRGGLENLCLVAGNNPHARQPGPPAQVERSVMQVDRSSAHSMDLSLPPSRTAIRPSVRRLNRAHPVDAPWFKRRAVPIGLHVTISQGWKNTSTCDAERQPEAQGRVVNPPCYHM